ncbi:hypothetical protein Bca52824_001573 [Brassica carinata]|uniref:Uncharacterized protein n=1 Tax=Brassica carinata TaxID=52824 RepID=A0A8X7WGB7_BRACI|nr:hypothetical protein Bca52824_001573 [Brassica carinata]
MESWTDVNAEWNDVPDFDPGTSDSPDIDSDGEDRRESNNYNIEKEAMNFVDEPQVKVQMGLDYSYSQPSASEEYGGNTADSGYSETEHLIRQDQAEIDTQRAAVQYPPQPEVEFGFPQTCYCGARPLLATSADGML